MERPRETRILPAASGEPDVTAQPTQLAPVMRRPSRALVPANTSRPANDSLLIVPADSRRALPTTIRRVPQARKKRVLPTVLAFVTVAASVIAVLALTTRPATPTKASVPPPSGRGPWTTAAELVVAPPPPPTPTPIPPTPVGQTRASAPTSGGSALGGASALEPCKDSSMFVANISQWTVPPGCYGMIYQPNPANYVQRPGFGYCNWWVRVTHPATPDITENTSYPRGGVPAAGEAVFFDGNEQGALSEGHWAQVVAVAPDHYWILISEMNFAWRGGGFGRIDYRYVHVSPGLHFVYGV